MAKYSLTLKRVVFNIILIILFTTPALAAEKSDWQFYCFGVNLEWVQTAKWEQVAAGAVASVLTHTAGHYLAAGITGSRIHQDGFREHCTVDSGGDARWIARAGFIAQNGIGLILTSIPKTRHTDFTRGYVAMSAAETWTYPLVWHDDGDLDMIDKYGGNGDLEWGIYSAVAAHNMLRLKW